MIYTNNKIYNKTLIALGSEGLAQWPDTFCSLGSSAGDERGIPSYGVGTFIFSTTKSKMGDW